MRHDPKLSQWFTPEWLAKRIVHEFGPWDGLRVVEPAAGDGAFVLPLLEAGAARIDAYEIDPGWARVLSERVDMYHGDRHDAGLPLIQAANVHPANFLDRRPPTLFDRVVQNPPYENSLDLEFMDRALEWAPEVIAHVKLAALATSSKWERVWSRVRLTDLIILPKRPAYSGTKSGGRHDMCVVRYRRGRPGGGCDVRHWIEPERR